MLAAGLQSGRSSERSRLFDAWMRWKDAVQNKAPWKCGVVRGYEQLKSGLRRKYRFDFVGNVNAGKCGVNIQNTRSERLMGE